jgi:hypothetical protein
VELLGAPAPACRTAAGEGGDAEARNRDPLVVGGEISVDAVAHLGCLIGAGSATL